ncbi:hypothetical protein C1M53_22550 [Mesorhizobium sp. Pch-S]|nr:hypothetical protein C1M53_22550 [Mesorhizobium sp. Pch-S]
MFFRNSGRKTVPHFSWNCSRAPIVRRRPRGYGPPRNRTMTGLHRCSRLSTLPAIPPWANRMSPGCVAG